MIPLLLALACQPGTVSPPSGGGSTGDDTSDSGGDDTSDSGGDEGGGDEGGGDEGGGDESGDEGADDWSPLDPDPSELPAGMPTLGIELDPAAMARLDADPYEAEDERGVFIDPEGTRHEVDLSYRGAYALKSVMSSYDLRNWKVKLDSGDAYEGRREWNFNYEPHFRQKLAYDLFAFAGVAVPQAMHVLLELNGEPQGMYLQYEDPDNKPWLWDNFGDDEGDLYKAAYDLPGQPQCFADLTWLGSADSDYDCHYAKKTNHKVAPGDYTVLRELLDPLNHSDEDEVIPWFQEAVDLDRLLSYLVVSNFIANWDSYPQRPKNYWLYQDLRAGRFVFIPWDLDGTFNPSKDATYNQMGTTASIWFNLLQSDYSPPHADEGRERPLVRRLLADEGWQAAYLARYQELSEGILAEDYLLARLDALDAIVQPHLSAADRSRLTSANTSVRSFIEQRTSTVAAELTAPPPAGP